MAFTIDELPLQLSQYCVGQNIYRVVDGDTYYDTYIRDISIVKSRSDRYTVEFWNAWDGNSQAKRFYSDSGKELTGRQDSDVVVTSYTTNNDDVSHLSRDVIKGEEESIGVGNAQVYLFSTEDANGKKAAALFNNPAGWIGRVIHQCTSDYKHRKESSYANPIGNDYYFLTIPSGCTVQMEGSLESIQISPYLNIYKLPEATDTKYYWEGLVEKNDGSDSQSITFKRDRMVWEDKEITISVGSPAQAKYGTSVYSIEEDLTFKVEESTFPFDLKINYDYPFGVSGSFKYGKVTSVRVETTREVSKKCTAKIKAYYRDGSPVDGYLLVTQLPDLYFEVDPKSIHAPKEGGDYTVTVRTNMQYKMEAKESTTDFGTTWFTVAQANSIKEIQYLVTVKPNPSSRSFNGRIVFTPTGKSPVIVNITQDGDAPYVTYEPNYTEIDKGAHTWEVIRRHNLPSIIERENLAGLTYIKEEISPYPNAVTKYTITASENTSSADRGSYLETTSNLSFWDNVEMGGSGEVEEISARYNVVQRSSIVFDIVDTNYLPVRHITVPAKTNTVIVYVKHNIPWSDTVDNPDWITGPNNSIVPEPGTHYYEMGFVIATNEGDARDGTVTFKSHRGGTIVLHIHQEAGFVPLIKVSPESITVDSNAHTAILNVYATHPWSLISTQGARFILPDWLDLDIVKGSAGVTEIKVSIKQALLVDRAELLTFKLDDYEAYDDATIIQRGIENGYDITDVQDDSDWSKRKETKIRDKYLKVKIRYTGNELAIITALKTLYETSFA